MRYQLTPVRMAIIRITKDGMCCEDTEKLELLYIVGENVKWCSHYGNRMEVLQKIKNRTAMWSSNATSGYISKELQSGSGRDSYTPMCIATLLTIAKIWKQSWCPSADKWIKKRCCLHTTEYYSTFKKKEVLPFVTTWIDLENIMLSEMCHKRTNTAWFHFLRYLK